MKLQELEFPKEHNIFTSALIQIMFGFCYYLISTLFLLAIVLIWN